MPQIPEKSYKNKIKIEEKGVKKTLKHQCLTSKNLYHLWCSLQEQLEKDAAC